MYQTKIGNGLFNRKALLIFDSSSIGIDCKNFEPQRASSQREARKNFSYSN